MPPSNTVRQSGGELASRRGRHGYHIDKRSAGYTLDTQRQAALAEVDDAPFSMFHVKVALVAGAGCVSFLASLHCFTQILRYLFLDFLQMLTTLLLLVEFLTSCKQ
jgi:hypothetical protein